MSSVCTVGRCYRASLVQSSHTCPWSCCCGGDLDFFIGGGDLTRAQKLHNLYMKLTDIENYDQEMRHPMRQFWETIGQNENAPS